MESTPTVASVRDLLDAAADQQSSDTGSARRFAQQARVLARTQGDAPGEADALYRLACIAYSNDESDDAFAIALDARELAKKVGATAVEVNALSLVGIVYYNAGNFSEALECALQSLELYRRTNQRLGEGNLLNTIAAIHHSLGDTDRALVTYEAALTVNKELDQPEHDALTLSNMAEVRASRNETLLALSLSESALELSRVHLPSYVPDILARLGETYLALDAFDHADECLDEAHTLLAARSESTPEMRSTAQSLMMARGRVALARGDLHLATREFRAALDVATQNTMRAAVIGAHAELAQVYKRLGRFEEALAHQEARFTQHEELFSCGTDLRIKTLQIAHDTEAARQHAEILRLRTGELEAMVRGRTYDLEEYQLKAFERVAALSQHRGSGLADHTVDVGELAADVAAELGEPNHWVRQLRLATRLHDIGKVVVSDAILLKPGPLTLEERAAVQGHASAGAELLSGSPSQLIQLAAVVAQHHHEHWNGAGYPAGLAGTDIPIAARIASIADVYDALTTDCAYRPAWNPVDAVRHVVEASGSAFDPRIVDAFVRVVQRQNPDIAPSLATLATSRG